MPTTLHYGNHPDREQVQVGDLASYSTVRCGNLKVKVTDVRPITDHGARFGDQSYVRVRVTSRNAYAYRCGEVLDISPLHLSKR